MKAIYPGTLDPITLGHINIIERAAKLFDSVVIGVANNKQKHPLFTLEERLVLARESVNYLPNVSVEAFESLLVDFACKHNANVIIRGIRTTADFEFEYQLAAMNRRLSHQIETIFLTPQEEFSCISSSLVREIASLNGDISDFVSQSVDLALQRKFSVKELGK